jgi:hypothetical protein
LVPQAPARRTKWNPIVPGFELELATLWFRLPGLAAFELTDQVVQTSAHQLGRPVERLYLTEPLEESLSAL